ncbi:MAG: Hsp70 family protein, partial [Candidatus Thermoplasmatota archaeon]|nr:Hsp70 family protein [Candidatus Thermoplasmatota archaeon]
ETLGSVSTKLIERNTTIPTKRSQIFSTAADFQTSVTIHVLQGERPMATDNTTLGMFNLVGIPPAPRGLPQIEVTFDIDANGIMNVSAKDLGTGKEQKITITASTKLSKEETDRMMKEAEKHAEEDKKKKEEVEIRNNADSMIYTSEKTVKELAEKIGKDEKEKIESSVKELRDALSGKDIQKIKNKTDELGKKLQEIGAKIYQQVAQEQAKKQGKQEKKEEKEGKEEKKTWKGHPTDEKVVDAEYKVEDEEKK